MTGGSNKDRVYVALYFRQGQTSLPNSIETLGYARFHWAIWIEPKGSKGNGRYYQVQDQPAMNTAHGLQAGGWRFGTHTADVRRSAGFLGRIMIGKLPQGTSHHDVSNLLSTIELPRDNVDPIENCVSWTSEAIGRLQHQGWAEQFRVRDFKRDAFDTANNWYGDGNPLHWQRKNRKANYTDRTFP